MNGISVKIHTNHDGIRFSASLISRVLRRCHPEQSSCSCKFGCRSFTSLEQFLFWLSCVKTCVFLLVTTRLDFTEYFTFRFCVETETPQANVKFDLPKYFSLWTIVDCERWWFEIFKSFKLVQPVRLFQEGFWLAYYSVFYRSIEHAEDTVIPFVGNCL